MGPDFNLLLVSGNDRPKKFCAFGTVAHSDLHSQEKKEKHGNWDVNMKVLASPSQQKCKKKGLTKDFFAFGTPAYSDSQLLVEKWEMNLDRKLQIEIWKFWHPTLSRRNGKRMNRQKSKKNIKIKFLASQEERETGQYWTSEFTIFCTSPEKTASDKDHKTSPDKIVFRQFKLISMKKNSLCYANQISTLWNFAQFVVASFGRLLVLTYWEKWNIWRFWTWVEEKQIYENLW